MPATVLTGIVTSAGVMAKTVTMTTYIRHKKYLVHDPENVLSVGEHIQAQACRPLSARKRFTLLQSLGFPAGHGSSHGAISEEERRARNEAALSADQREWMRIEERVRAEARAQRGSRRA
ncbi:hypothetical protein MCUN1_001242 [Malassezia cuniculi]|uniref:37S ribosomal protein S17, mitochondrial n=1 Tax=Malassezia cuniculi TaxID=948313 RepID=A0AAF0EPW4_9BASI|nr:hypothetical protein MCUN1_001242 [Malassezia cuniculi]